MYKIVKCPNCKNFAITTGDVAFNCLSCGKTFDVTKLRIYFQTDSGQVATKVLQKIKQEDFMKRRGSDGVDDFM